MKRADDVWSLDTVKTIQRLPVFALAVLLCVCASAQALQDPLNRLSPRSSVTAFLTLTRAGNYARASRYLNLRDSSPEQQQSRGAELARQLGTILERDTQLDLASLSAEPDGSLGDGPALKRQRVASFPGKGAALELYVEKLTLRSGLSIWIFAPATVGIVPQLFQVTSDSAIERELPAQLVTTQIAETPVWRWIVLVVLAILFLVVARLLAKLLLLCLRPLCKRFAPTLDRQAFQVFSGPLQVLLYVAMLRAMVEWVGAPQALQLYLVKAIRILAYASLAWLAMRVISLVVSRMGAALETRRATFSRSALPLVSRILKVAIVAVAVAAVLGDLGYNTSTLLAGLGIGGIAIALAAQKTIENLFGGVALVGDRPVFVGDVCRFGDRLGTVEEVGLRSTRIRTLDRTLVIVPNLEFSTMTLENYSRRDKMWFHPTLNLRRDTTPDQVRQILQSLQQILTDDPIMETGELPVRFVGVGSYSLDIEISSYVLTSEGDQFLRIQQNLLLRILDAVAAAGTALALPTQASVTYSEQSH